MKDLNRKYGIDAYLYADIGTVLLLVLSDCLGYFFSSSVIVESPLFVHVDHGLIISQKLLKHSLI